MRQTRHWMLALWLSILCTATFASCTANEDHPSEVRPTVQRITERGTLLVGTTGDYRPLSYREPDGNYWGFGIEIAEKIAEHIGVGIDFVQTSWPTLTSDVLAKPQTFDLAIGGITITDARKETMLMSDGYLANGKTILCRAADADRYQSLADIDKPEVRVMVNPGGLNEKFANENLTHAQIIVYQKNEEIPSQVAEGHADVMITEITEAPWYVQNDPRLAAPLLNNPFTHGEIGVLMRKGQDDLLGLVNSVIAQMKADGSLRKLHEKYGLVYVTGGSVTPSQSRVGYSARETQVSYTHCDPLPKTGKPELVSGTWEINDGILQHTASEQAPLAICNYVIPSDHYTIQCTARKDGGPEGFIIVFNYVDAQHYCQLNFGCGGNTQHAIEQISGNSKIQTAVRPGSVKTGKWYEVKLTVAGDSVKAWLDDELVFDEVLKNR